MLQSIKDEIERFNEWETLDVPTYLRVLRMVKTFIERKGIDEVPGMVERFKKALSHAPRTDRKIWQGWIPALDYAQLMYEQHKRLENLCPRCNAGKLKLRQNNTYCPVCKIENIYLGNHNHINRENMEEL